jgi:hypothetical protein
VEKITIKNARNAAIFDEVKFRGSKSWAGRKAATKGKIQTKSHDEFVHMGIAHLLSDITDLLIDLISARVLAMEYVHEIG